MQDANKTINIAAWILVVPATLFLLMLASVWVVVFLRYPAIVSNFKS